MKGTARKLLTFSKQENEKAYNDVFEFGTKILEKSFLARLSSSAKAQHRKLVNEHLVDGPECENKPTTYKTDLPGINGSVYCAVIAETVYVYK